MARKHMANVVERPTALTVMLHEMNSLTGERHADLLRLRDRAEGVWDQIVQQGVESGELRDLDPLCVKLILGALNYAVLWFRADGELTPDDVADRTVDLMLASAVVGADGDRTSRSQM